MTGAPPDTLTPPALDFAAQENFDGIAPAQDRLSRVEQSLQSVS
jgi:hypothetical protein